MAAKDDYPGTDDYERKTFLLQINLKSPKESNQQELQDLLDANWTTEYISEEIYYKDHVRWFMILERRKF